MFYVTDIIHHDECMVKYCPADDMITDNNTKPLVGNKFKVFRDLIMNLSGIIPRAGQQECVGHNKSATNQKIYKCPKNVPAAQARLRSRPEKITRERAHTFS